MEQKDSIVKLEDIGFYTLSDARAKSVTPSTSPIARCEILVTGRCNFRCSYCRSVQLPDANIQQITKGVSFVAKRHNCQAIRFSGGEPMLHPQLPAIVMFARMVDIPRVAISTNGSFSEAAYRHLLAEGANDFSISLDACCANTASRMAGCMPSMWQQTVDNIRMLASETYVTVGVVLTRDNESQAEDVVHFASELGVADIRLIPAAQWQSSFRPLSIKPEVLAKHPILRYRVQRINAGLPVRGLTPMDHRHCPLVLDDVAIRGGAHWPCIIYLREGGHPIGLVGDDMRAARYRWYLKHDTLADPICRSNCLDVCIAYNNRVAQFEESQQYPPQ